MTLSEEIRKGESDELEFKRDVPSEKVKLLKTVCAFANCNGGRIIVGVDDNRAIVGVDGMSAFKLADRLVDTISNGCSPQVPVTSEVASVEGKTVIVLSVQMGLHCPYFVRSLGKKNGTFVRVAATSRIVDEDSLKELELVGAGMNFDAQVLRGGATSKAEIDRLCARMLRIARENYEDGAARRKVKKATVNQLEDWGLLVRARGSYQPTHAYALLVGARKFHSEVRCGLFRGKTRAIFVDHKEIEGSVLDQIDGAYDFVLSKINVGMELVGTRRRDVYEIPLGAIRELIVNAIVHRIYINPRAMPVTVALYDDRLEVTSPGGLPHGMTMDMMLSGHSRSRNKSLALAFRYMNLIEEWGSGIPRIQEQLERAGLRPLTIESSGMDLRFVIWRKPAAVETINETISETIKKRETTNETISVAADIVAANPGIGRAALIGKVGKSRATVARALATLVAKGLVVYRGSRKCGGYYPCCVRG